MRPSATHSSSGAFYRAAYAASIDAEVDLGVLGVSILVSKQHDGDWSDACTPDLVVSVLRRGTVTATVDLGAGLFRRRRRQGELLVIAPHVGSRIHAQGHHEVLAIDVPYASLRALTPDLDLPDDGDFGRLHCDYVQDPLLAALLERVWTHGREPGPASPLFIETALTMLGAALADLSRRVVPTRRNGGLTPRQMRIAVERLDGCPHYRLSLSDLAQTVGLSPFHLLRAFKTSFGITPYAYLVNLRIERAKVLLETNGRSVTEIALEVGYESSQSLTRSFQRTLKVAPSAWRRHRR